MRPRRAAPEVPLDGDEPPLSVGPYVDLAGGPGHELEGYRLWATARRRWRERFGPLPTDVVKDGSAPPRQYRDLRTS